MNKPVYIFDADGVVNNLSVHEADQRVIEQIVQLLTEGHYIAINTGRGYQWVRENLIDILGGHVPMDMLDRVFVSAEMGGITVEFVNGVEQVTPSAFSLTADQIKQVKQVFEEHETKHIQWYEGKLSMATIDKPPAVDIVSFAAETKKIDGVLKQLFANQHVKVTITADAIDVTTPEAGKWAGAQLIHDWLQRTPAASAKHFVCFGDNTSDYEMARFFGRLNHTVEFVFTGEMLGEVEHDPHVTLKKTRLPYSDGTYEFLKKTKELL